VFSHRALPIFHKLQIFVCLRLRQDVVSKGNHGRRLNRFSTRNKTADAPVGIRKKISGTEKGSKKESTIRGVKIMIGYGVVNGKISKRKNKTGWSHNFLVGKNYRSEITGKPNFKVIWNFGTIRDTEFHKRANAFWKEVELVLTELVSTGKIYAADADKIRRQFAEYISVPVVPIVAPAPVPIAKKTNPSVAERVRKRFKDLL